MELKELDIHNLIEKFSSNNILNFVFYLKKIEEESKCTLLKPMISKNGFLGFFLDLLYRDYIVITDDYSSNFHLTLIYSNVNDLNLYYKSKITASDVDKIVNTVITAIASNSRNSKIIHNNKIVNNLKRFFNIIKEHKENFIVIEKASFPLKVEIWKQHNRELVIDNLNISYPFYSCIVVKYNNIKDVREISKIFENYMFNTFNRKIPIIYQVYLDERHKICYIYFTLLRFFVNNISMLINNVLKEYINKYIGKKVLRSFNVYVSIVDDLLHFNDALVNEISNIYKRLEDINF